MSLDMPAIKAEISAQLAALGYTTKCRAFVNYEFTLTGNYMGKFEIASANVGRFEVRVDAGNQTDFLIPCRRDDTKRVHCATKRFSKIKESIAPLLEWVASATKVHHHLKELLHPELPLPDPTGFAEGDFVPRGDRWHHGFVNHCQVVDVVTSQGRVVHKTAYNPSHRPYFLLRVECRNPGNYGDRNHDILTDGDVWYPTIQLNDRHIVFHDPEVVEALKQMNHGDQQLIHKCLQAYVTEHYSEDGKDQKANERASG